MVFSPCLLLNTPPETGIEIDSQLTRMRDKPLPQASLGFANGWLSRTFARRIGSEFLRFFRQ